LCRDKEEIITHVERVKELSQKEQTPDVAEHAKNRLSTIKAALEVMKDAGGLAIKAGPYLTALWQFFAH
jgi:hypothetical protein